MIPPVPVARVRCGLVTSPFSSATKPGGTVTTAATRPDCSCCDAWLSDMRTISTFFATWSISPSTSKLLPAMTTRCGMPSRSTSATRGFALAYAAVRPISNAITSG